jgi:transcriptional regulator with XRE-family HTH domain
VTTNDNAQGSIVLDPPSFGAQVRAWREAAGLSQTALQRLIGMGGGWLCLVEAGDRVPDKAQCDRLNEALGLPDGMVWLRAARLRDPDVFDAAARMDEALMAENAALRARVAELEQRLEATRRAVIAAVSREG